MFTRKIITKKSCIGAINHCEKLLLQLAQKEGARSILCTQARRGSKLDNGEIIEAKMTAFFYSAAGYSGARSVRDAPRRRHDAADSHLSEGMNRRTVTATDTHRRSYRGRREEQPFPARK